MSELGDIYAPGGLVERMIADNQVQDENVPNGEHASECAAMLIAAELQAKAMATLTARLARHGYGVVQVPGGRYLINRPAMHRSVDTLSDLELFVVSVERGSD